MALKVRSRVGRFKYRTARGACAHRRGGLTACARGPDHAWPHDSARFSTIRIRNRGDFQWLPGGRSWGGRRSMHATVTEARDADTIDLREVVARVRGRRSWVIGSVLVCTVGFTAAAFLMRPVYRGKSILIPTNASQGSDFSKSPFGQLGGLASLAGLDVGKSSPTDEALAVLKS